MKMRTLSAGFIAVMMIVGTLAIAAQTKTAAENQIVLGQSCALTGPAGELGRGVRAGLLAAFDEANANGGVKGRKIKLISLDDGYEPALAIANTRKLLGDENTLLLIGEVGTPTSKAVMPIVDQEKVPFFGPFTGAEFLRNPHDRYVINVRASYFEEMEKQAEYLVDRKGLRRIACFYQDDDFGEAGLNGIRQALRSRSLSLAATGSYERNTVAIKRALLTIRKNQPQAIVMVGAYKPCAEFIKLARSVGMTDVVFSNISFVGTDALLAELAPETATFKGGECIISQVVAYPWDTSIPLVAEYQAAMKTYQPYSHVGFVSLEGYITGRLFCFAAKKTSGELTRESLIDQIDNLGEFKLGGLQFEFGPEDHQGLDQVFLTTIKGNKIVPLEE